jgi:periplasmic divalent cation tolerance protein
MLFSANADMATNKILVGWMTVDSAAAAEKLAAGLVAARLAACAQVDGPVTSHYIWQGKQERAKEWRVWVKFTASRAKDIEAWLKAHHPYSTPQWLAVEAAVVAESYREWVVENTRAKSKTR